MLLQGITAAERKKGYGTAIPNGVTLTSVEIDDEKAELTLIEQLRRRRRLLPRAGGPGRLHGDRRRLDIEEVEIRGQTFTRADFGRRRTTPRPSRRRKKLPRRADPEAVQTKLAQLGYLPDDAVTGKWDYRTQQAVLAFQSWENLSATGSSAR